MCESGRKGIKKMFQLEGHGAYHWNDVFCLLNFDNADPYLHEIDFPFEVKNSSLVGIARRFVEGFDGLLPTIYIADEPLERVQQFFADIFQELVAALGEEKAVQFCQWGNYLQIDHATEVSVREHISILARFYKPSASIDEQLPWLADEKKKWLMARIEEYRLRSLRISDEIEELEKASFTDWEKYVLSVYFPPEYYLDDEDLYAHTPYLSLWTWINFCDDRNLLRAIGAKLNPEELNRLIEWFVSHPDWLRTLENIQRYNWKYPLYNLMELLDRL